MSALVVAFLFYMYLLAKSCDPYNPKMGLLWIFLVVFVAICEIKMMNG